MMLIRKGTKADMPAVLDLIRELAIFEKEPDAVVVTVADLEKDGFGDKPLFHTFIAELDNEIVGMALYYYRYSTWKGKTIHLEDLIVKEKMRGTGLGLPLVKALIELHGGSLEIESAAGRGTTVRLQFPPGPRPHQAV